MADANLQSEMGYREVGGRHEQVVGGAALDERDTDQIRTLYGLVTVAFAFLTWVIDALLDALVFYHRPVVDLLFFDVPPYEMYVRLSIIGCFVVFGWFASKMAVRQKRVERELARTGMQLDQRVRERTAELSETNDQLKQEVGERQRIEATLRDYTQRLKILHEIDQAILELQAPGSIFQRVLDRIYGLIPFRWASIRVLDPGDRGFVPAAQIGLSEEMLRLRAHLSIEDYAAIGESVREGKIYLARDTHVLSEKPDFIRALEVEGLRSFLSVPLVFQGKTLGILSLGAEMPDAFTAEHVETAREIAASLAVATQNTRLLSSLNDKSEELRSLATRLVEVEEAERRQLARDLHDGIGQNLSALNLNLNIIARMLPRESTEAVRARLVDSERLLEDTVAAIRDLMSDLRTPVLDEHGLGAALHSHIAQVSERTAIPIGTDIEELVPRPSPRVETALFRIAQEALSNVARHSHATRATVMLLSAPGGVRLTVMDNGVGFKPEAVSSQGEGRSRLGLIGIRERAEAVGGSLQIDSSPNKGTCLTVEVPGIFGEESPERV